jgi:hypothetical protein
MNKTEQETGKMTLVRKNNRSVTYYKVVLYPTLFNDFLLVHYCGLHCNRASKKSYYKTKKEALIGSLNVLSAKRAEGFELLR